MTVAAAMMEEDLVLLSLERRSIKGNWREMVGVKMGGRNVLAHGGFMLVKCVVSGPKFKWERADRETLHSSIKFSFHLSWALRAAANV